MIRSQRPVLIADPDRDFISSLVQDYSSLAPPPVIADNEAEALLRVSEPDRAYSGIFLNPRISASQGLSVIRFAHTHHLGTPLFLLHDDGDKVPFTPQNLKALGVHEALRKPLLYREILALVAPIAESFDAAEVLVAAAGATKESTGTEFSAQDFEFSPILAENFLSGKTCLFDVYIRLKTGRYLKLLQTGDAFQADQLLNYLKKGVRHFHVRKEVQAAYLHYCEHLSTALLRNEAAPGSLKTSQVLNAGEETMRFLLNNGLTEEHLEYASRFVGNVQTLVKELKLEENTTIRRFLYDLVAYEHGVATAMVASLLARAFEVKSERVKNVIGLAALLHDVGLYAELGNNQLENEDRMTVTEKLRYRSHPKASSRILREVKGMDPAVILAVEQHHERRDGTGFPQGLAAGTINRIAELIGISDEFVRLIVKSKSNTAVDPIKEIEKKMFNGFSFPVINSFSQMFLGKEGIPRLV